MGRARNKFKKDSRVHEVDGATALFGPVKGRGDAAAGCSRGGDEDDARKPQAGQLDSQLKVANTHLTYDRVERERTPSSGFLDSIRIALRRETGAADLSAASNAWGRPSDDETVVGE